MSDETRSKSEFRAIASLAAEIERLRTENERLTKERDQYREWWAELQRVAEGRPPRTVAGESASNEEG